MVKKILRSRCLSLYAIFTTLILWCGVVETQQPASEILDRFTDDIQLELILDPALKVAEKYACDDYVDRLVNAEHYKRLAQQEFNEHLCARLALLPNFEVGIYAKDLMKSGFLAIDWLVEWLIYKWCCWYATHIMLDHLISHADDYLSINREFNKGIITPDQRNKKLQELNPHATIFKSFSLLADKNFIFFITNMILVAQLTQASKKSLLLVQEPNFMGLFKAPQGDSKKPTSLFTFVERHPVLSIPLSPSRGGVTTAINMVFKSWGLLPDWTDCWYVTIGTEISFLLFFLLRIHTTQLCIRWMTWASNSTDILQALLAAHQNVMSNSKATTQEREEVEHMLKRYIAQGYTISFLEWMSYKVFWYGIWQTAVNCTFALPAWIKLGKSAYQLWQTTQNDAHPDDELEIV